MHHTGRGQRGNNGNRMDETLIKDAKNDVDSGQGGKNEQRFVGQRIGGRTPPCLESRLQAGGEVKVLHHFSMSVIAVPSEAFEARLNEHRDRWGTGP